MKTLVLQEPVRIRGRDYRNHPAELNFEPGPQSRAPGWYWRQDDRLVPLEVAMATTGPRRMILRDGNYELGIFEHVGPLWWLGLRHVTISGSMCPPFTGGVWDYYQEVLKHCSVVDSPEEPKYQTVSEPVRWQYPGDRVAYVEIWPATRPGVTLTIHKGYPRLEPCAKAYALPDQQSLEKICQTNTVGLPHWLYYPSRVLAPRLSRQVNWLRPLGQCRWNTLAALHRAQDLLGALSLLCSHDTTFVGNVHCFRAGHQADVEVLRLAAAKLCPYP